MKILSTYPYRTGYVRGHVVYYPRDIMASLEQYLKVKTGVEGNHVCFLVELDAARDRLPDPVHGYVAVKGIMFTDNICSIGNRVDAGRW